ncbi:peptidase C39 family protein [Streptomyces sp. 3MP-14]|uniref:Peptidase C39 family protein n=1 Tax=Streptomyces mimosae TaxID=2586635 RepID=A0A5N6A1K6_9ACTN|nr:MULTISPECIES: peptidase C39 family protein [Streptomyces]KAB8162647.1 peptidase C39 family protein [Streptomyces mimosae]KAB8174474.1 peptidase C39 family protein [Streptomyces sp. 3MP-14]
MTSTPRRTVLAAAVAAVGTATALSAAPTALAAGRSAGRGRPRADSTIEYHAWTTAGDWRAGTGDGVAVVAGARPGVRIDAPAGTVDYTDPHLGTTATYEYATWVSPSHAPATPGGELIASWNADTPAGTFVRIEVRADYSDGTQTPWYTLGIWASGDEDIHRTSVDGQEDGKSTVWTDTLAIDDTETGPRFVAYQLRLTLHRAAGGDATPTVWRIGAMTSDVPARFEVPASSPGVASGIELDVPTYSQNIHVGRYPEYDNGGEAWCSPTSSQMIIESWGRAPTPEDLAWVNPDYDDPQVCHAARFTFDYQYDGCGNWPFNAAYAATYPDLEGIVTRIASLDEAEELIAAGIPLITSQSFYEAELDGAGYGTSGHLMTVVGFTEDGDIIANDPASTDNSTVRRVYPRRQFENIWLRTQRYDENGAVRSGTGGVCYLYFPANPTARQRRALRRLGCR